MLKRWFCAALLAVVGVHAVAAEDADKAVRDAVKKVLPNEKINLIERSKLEGFYQVVASAFIFVFAKVLTAMFQAIGHISISNAFTVLPALMITLFVCIFGLFKIPELTSAILSGRTGTWVNPMGD